MDKIEPLLSICIPTYNRCNILKDVLNQYLNNPEFDEDVEIIISDNASTDGTCEMCQAFCLRAGNIHYYRNKENIRDANFVKVLDLAKGMYLKLFNDWAYCTVESLRYIKERIRENLVEKKPVYFSSGNIFTQYKAEVVYARNLDEFVRVVSTFVTYNNLFGVWKEQWKAVADKGKYSALQLQQVDWIYQIVSQNGGCVIYDKPVFWSSSVSLGARGGYNWFKIHLDNYYTIMCTYVKKGCISSHTFIEDKHNLLEHFKPEFSKALFYNYDKAWNFETRGTVNLLLKYYRKDPYVIYYLVKLLLFFTFQVSKPWGVHLRNYLLK